MPPTVPTDPGSVGTTTTKQVADEPSPTDPVIENDVTSEIDSDNPEPISLVPTPVEVLHSYMPMPSVIISTIHMPNIIPLVVLGTVASLLVIIIVITIIAIVVFLWLKSRRFKRTSVSITTNPAYEVSVLKSTTAPNPKVVNLRLQNMDTSLEYAIVTKQNDAYISVVERRVGARDAIITETNEAYICNSATVSGIGARDAIITETNEAYICNSATVSGIGARDTIVTEKNEAYICNSATVSGIGARDAIITETNEAYICNSATVSGIGARDTIVTEKNEAYMQCNRSWC